MPRIHFEGALFHILSRGNYRQNIFSDREDYQNFQKILSNTKRLLPFQLYAYCLMPNHFHLLIQVDTVPVSRILHRILTLYANSFNSKHNRTGHLFQGRFKALVCDRNAYLLQLIRYIHLNPVRSSLVDRPSEWEWSSHREYVGELGFRLADRGFPLSLFSEIPQSAKDRYLRFIGEESDDGQGAVLYIPDADFNRKGPGNKTTKPIPQPPLPRSIPPNEAVSLEMFCEKFAKRSGMPINILKSKGRQRNIVHVRNDFIRQSIRMGFTMTQIAHLLNRTRSAISKAYNQSAKNALHRSSYYRTGADD